MTRFIFTDGAILWALISIAVGLLFVAGVGVWNTLSLLRHESREFKRADLKEKREQENHEKLLKEVRDMRALALAAISQRNDIEKRLTTLEGWRKRVEQK